MNFRPKTWLFSIFAVLFLATSTHAADWYRWRGPDLNGISRETGWLAKWPDNGPNQLWKASLGAGCSSISVSRGRAYTMGNIEGGFDVVYCLDAATGKLIWRHSYLCDLDPKNFEGGPAATPAVDGDRVYTFSRKGDLLCLDAAYGRIIWAKNVSQDLGCKSPDWGFAGSPLVEGGLVILNAGSAGTAFDKTTGNLAWSSGRGKPGYATPVSFDNGGQRPVAIFGLDALHVINPTNGKSLWNFPWKSPFDINAADPVISSNKLFLSSGYGHGCALIDDRGEPRVYWQNKNLQIRLNNAILWNGYIYSADQNGELKCVSWDTGEIKWTDKTFGEGSLIIADGKIIGLSERGELMVADPTPAGFKPISRVQVLGGKCRTLPVLANGRIYCRNAKGDLVCLDVAGQ
jgi:outer membrane protein assembly factor BamB